MCPLMSAVLFALFSNSNRVSVRTYILYLLVIFRQQLLHQWDPQLYSAVKKNLISAPQHTQLQSKVTLAKTSQPVT